MGHHVVMGRKTWESLHADPMRRGLPGRAIIMLTRRWDVAENDYCFPPYADDPNYLTFPGGHTETRSEWRFAKQRAEQRKDTELFVAGGSEIYAKALPETDRIYLTRVHAHVSGDVYLPEIDWSQWVEVSREHHAPDARHIHSFSFISYERAPT